MANNSSSKANTNNPSIVIYCYQYHDMDKLPAPFGSSSFCDTLCIKPSSDTMLKKTVLL